MGKKRFFLQKLFGGEREKGCGGEKYFLEGKSGGGYGGSVGQAG